MISTCVIIVAVIATFNEIKNVYSTETIFFFFLINIFTPVLTKQLRSNSKLTNLNFNNKYLIMIQFLIIMPKTFDLK